MNSSPSGSLQGRGQSAARRAALAGALFGFSGVAAGAFGAHALKTRLEPDALAVFDTAVRYHVLHALALFGSSWTAQQWPGRSANASAILFCLGIVLFSGSLYALTLSGVRVLGALTPVGGVLLLLGWLALAVAAYGKGR